MASTRNTLSPYLAISAGDLSGDLVSTATNVKFHDRVTIQLSATTANANGTWAIQVSNVPGTPGTAANSKDWLTLSITPPLAFTGTTNPTIGTSFDKFAWNWVRAVYTASSGTGTVNMYLSAVGH